MKKIRFFLPVFAFGALLFGMAGCDTGNDKYIVEDPTTWCRYSGSDPADNSDKVVAKWTFATDVDKITGTEGAHKDLKLTPDEGSEGATLTVGNEIAFKWVEASGTDESAGENTARIQASRKTASLENPADGLYLILETKGQTNITVRAKGAGGADASRILLITDANDEHLVWKNNLYSGDLDYFAFHVQAAPAGTYKIYCNGSTISEIVASSENNDVAQPVALSGNDELVLSKPDQESYESLIQTCKLTLTTDKDGKNVTNDAVWYSSDKSIATVKAGVVSAVSGNSEGTVTIRARIGRFYQEREVTFTPCTKQIITTFNSDSKDFPEAGERIDWDSTDIEKAAARNKFLATKDIGFSKVEIVPDDAGARRAGIVIHDILKTSTTTDNNVSKGVDGVNTGYQWKDSFSSPNVVEVGTEYVSFTFKVKPAQGVTDAKLSGIYGCVNSGKSGSSAALVGDVYIGGKKVNDVSYSVFKNNSDPYSQSFTPVSITEETEITLTFAVAIAKKNGISLQVRDVGLIFE